MADAIDPVCGATVDKEEAADEEEHEGTTYYFHSVDCAWKFRDDPLQYAK